MSCWPAQISGVPLAGEANGEGEDGRWRGESRARLGVGIRVWEDTHTEREDEDGVVCYIHPLPTVGRGGSHHFQEEGREAVRAMGMGALHSLGCYRAGLKSCCASSNTMGHSSGPSPTPYLGLGWHEPSVTCWDRLAPSF